MGIKMNIEKLFAEHDTKVRARVYYLRRKVYDNVCRQTAQIVYEQTLICVYKQIDDIVWIPIFVKLKTF